MLSEVSENPPLDAPSVTATTHNQYTSTTEPPISDIQSPRASVAIPAVPSRLKDKIISGEFIDFTSLLSKAMFLGTQSLKPSRLITVHLSSEKNDFSVRPTPPPRKISSFSTWMEAWNTYLAIVIDHAPAHAPQLVAYQRIITSASIQYPLAAWLNYDVRFRTLAASDPLLRWNVRLTDLWLECFSGTPASVTRWPCVQCGSTSHYPENCLFVPNLFLNAGEDNTHHLCQHPLEDSTHQLHQVTYLSLLVNPMKADPPWNSLAAKGHNGPATPSTAPSAIVVPVPSYMHLCKICGASHSARLCPRRDSLAP